MLSNLKVSGNIIVVIDFCQPVRIPCILGIIKYKAQFNAFAHAGDNLVNRFKLFINDYELRNKRFE